MGDNRDNSQDSRVTNQVGFVPLENLVGRAEILFFSTDSAWFGGIVFLVDRAQGKQDPITDKII